MRTPDWFLKKNLVAYLLRPVSLVYYAFSKIVYFFRRFWQKSSKRPVVCIGNILAGGVGKTPIVMQIAKHLNAPVIMRGYKAEGDRQKAKGGTSVKAIGDEAKMLVNAGLEVYVGDRLRNISKINNLCRRVSDFCPIIMDDGFQNPTVRKDLSVLVFDESIGLGNGFILPAGPLREPLSAIRRADAIIIIRQNAKCKIQKFVEKLKKYKIPVFYADNKTLLPSRFGFLPFVAFAGIGYPQKFFDALSSRPAAAIAFPDHYQYKPADLKKLFALAESKNAELITTEKDWVRLPAAMQKKIKFAKLETTIEPDFWEFLEKKVK